MGIFTKGRANYKCNTCKMQIPMGTKHLNLPQFQYGSKRFCVDCVIDEIDAVLLIQHLEKKKATEVHENV